MSSGSGLKVRWAFGDGGTVQVRGGSGWVSVRHSLMGTAGILARLVGGKSALALEVPLG